jgi:hypothetical protein
MGGSSSGTASHGPISLTLRLIGEAFADGGVLGFCRFCPVHGF